jgi:hypothetical protein
VADSQSAKVIDLKDSPRRGTRTRPARLQAIARKRYEPGRASTGMLYLRRKSDGQRLSFSTADRRKVTTDLRTEWIARHPREQLADADIRYVINWLEGQAETAAKDAPTAEEQADESIGRLVGEQPDYYVQDNCTWWNKPAMGGGTVPFMLATFAAEIAEEVTLDDGSERTLTWLIRVTARDGRKGEVRIPPDQLGRPQQWAAKAAGTSALVMPGQTVQDHLRVAVHSASESVVMRTVHTHTGWSEVGGKHVYLSSSGALGADGLDTSVTVELADALAGYCLPGVTGVTALRKAVRASIGLLEIAANDVMASPLAATYRAPLPLLPDCAVWAYGPSGAFKTETTSLAQQHFGAGMSSLALPGHWTSTANRLEMEAHVLANALFVVDDFSPAVSAADARVQEGKAEKLIRGSANHSATGRLRPDATMRPAKPPRAQVLTSAEDLPPSSPSLRARAMIEELRPGAVDLALLTQAQKDAASGVLALAMSGYIRSIAARWDADPELPAKLRAQRDRFRDRHRTKGHPRFAVNVASLELGWHEWLAYAAEAEAITAAERDKCWARVRKALARLGAEQERYQRDGDPVSVYLRSLIALVASGRAHLACPDGTEPADPGQWGWQADGAARADDPRTIWRPQGQRIGWVDGDEVYLQPDAAYTAARQYADAGGTPLAKTKTVLHKALRERGLLKGTAADRLTVQRNVGGQRNKHVLNLAADIFGARSDEK